MHHQWLETMCLLANSMQLLLYFDYSRSVFANSLRTQNKMVQLRKREKKNTNPSSSSHLNSMEPYKQHFSHTTMVRVEFPGIGPLCCEVLANRSGNTTCLALIFGVSRVIQTLSIHIIYHMVFTGLEQH